MSAPARAPNQKPPLALSLFGVGLFGAGAYYLAPRGYAPEWQVIAFAFCALCAAIGSLNALSEATRIARAFARRAKARNPGDTHGSAAFADGAYIRKNRLNRPASVFVGLSEDGPPVFYDPVHCFVLAPTGTGKTVRFVTTRLALCPDSMLVTDYKRELVATTARLRAKKHGQRVVVLDATDPKTDTINPIAMITDDAATSAGDAIATATAYAAQMVQVKADHNNAAFGFQARDDLAFALLWAGVHPDPARRMMSEAARIILNPEALDETFAEAVEREDVLGGELAVRALALATLKENTPKFWSDSMVQAVQAMRPFSRNGLAARLVSGSSFDPIELKERPTTAYLSIDSTRQDELAPVAALIVKYCLMRLARAGDGRRVRFLLDEATNLSVHGLPEAFTGLRGLGIGVDFIAQSMSEIERVYGRHAVQTFVSQSDLRIFHSIADYETAKLVSSMIGSFTTPTENYAFGQTATEDVGLSMAAAGRPRLTPDELMRLPADRLVAFAGHHRAFLLRGLTYAEIAPIRRWVDPHPIHKSRLKGRIKMRLSL